MFIAIKTSDPLQIGTALHRNTLKEEIRLNESKQPHKQELVVDPSSQERVELSPSLSVFSRFVYLNHS